jgi:hypothetical protein
MARIRRGPRTPRYPAFSLRSARLGPRNLPLRPATVPPKPTSRHEWSHCQMSYRHQDEFGACSGHLATDRRHQFLRRFPDHAAVCIQKRLPASIRLAKEKDCCAIFATRLTSMRIQAEPRKSSLSFKRALNYTEYPSKADTKDQNKVMFGKRGRQRRRRRSGPGMV